MYKVLAWLKRALIILAVGVVLPLYFFANSQSLVDYAERRGPAAISVGVLGKIMGSNALLMWWKVLGVMPLRSLVPGMGQNWAAIDDLHQKFKWGGCSLIYDAKEERRSFVFARGFARCDGVSNTQINPAFSGLSDEQQQLLVDAKERLMPGEHGPRDYEEVAYALMANMAAVGVEPSKRVMDRSCAKAYLGIDSARLECFAFLELVQTLEEVVPKNENERRAVAIKAGGGAWFWALADEKLGGLQMAALRQAGGGQKAASLYARAAQWRSLYLASPDTKERFSLTILSRPWGRSGLEELNQFLRLRKKRPIEQQYWDEALSGQ